MIVETLERKVTSAGEGEIHDLTPEVAAAIAEVGIEAGTATIFAPGSTAAVTTIEYEPGVVADITGLFERLAPATARYAHELAWHDGNGHSHVRAGLLGPSLVVPVSEGRLVLGTWQQVVLIDFDNKPRRRRWTLTLMGE